MTSSRQLAAIMFTDIVGYTALMGKDTAMMGDDEVKAMELLQKNRQVQKPIIERYNGKWIKEIGDGVLASFNTVSDAVYCAIDIQKACESEPELNLRIGIHLGDIVFEGDDVFGDGVNIASRLEALAPAGGIWISDSVNRSIQNKQGIETRFIREEQLKNVKEAVRIYEVKVDGLEHSETVPNKASKPVEDILPAKSKRKMVLISLATVAALSLVYFFYPFQGKHEAPYGPKTIAVLAFDDQSPEGDQEWLGDGMADEILNLLAKVDGLQVTGKTSSFSFKGKNATIGQIGETLEVKTILEGSVSKVGDKYRFTAQLIDVDSEAHLWSDKYDRESSEIFLLVDEIAQKIAGSLISELSMDQVETIQMAYKPELEAFEYFIKAEQILIDDYFSNYDNKTLLKAKEMYLKAIAIDPDYMDALAGLASIYYEFGDFQKRDSILNIAYRIDPNSPNVLYFKGTLNKDIDSAFTFLSKAYELDPLHTGSTFLIEKSNRLGFFDLSINLCRKYLAEDPTNRFVQYLMLWALFDSGQFEEARDQARKLLEFDENNFYGNRYLFFITIIVDKDIPEAKKLSDRMGKIYPESGWIKTQKAFILAVQGKKDEALSLRPNHLTVYLLLDMREEALSRMDQIISGSDDPYTGFYGYLSLKGHASYVNIRQEPQFQQWLEEARVVHEERVRKYYHLFDD